MTAFLCTIKCSPLKRSGGKGFRGVDNGSHFMLYYRYNGEFVFDFRGSLGLELYKVIHEKRLDSDPHFLLYYVYNEKTN